MNCPFCGNEETRVLETRQVDGSVLKRRRMCSKCKRRFTTYERIEAHPLLVLKKDGVREPFDREKLKKGLIESCSKRRVSLDEIEKIVAEIEAILQEYLVEVPSQKIGELALERLKKIDQVAYIRFASVYREFDSIDTFLKEIRKIKKERNGRKK